MIDEQGLVELVAALAPGRPADELCGGLEAAVLSLQGGAPRDDIALLALRVL